MKVIRNADTGHTFAVDREFIHHLGSAHDVGRTAQVESALDEVHQLNNEDFRVQLQVRSIPLHYGDPEELRKYNPDGWWSRALEVRRAQDDIWRMLLTIRDK